MKPALDVDVMGQLLCPQCGHDCTHVDVVSLSNDHEGLALIASGEDEQGTVKAISYPFRSEGRRHTASLSIRCENGCFTVLSLRQHKGATIVTLAHAVSDILT